jgi:hypothetical protein
MEGICASIGGNGTKKKSAQILKEIVAILVRFCHITEEVIGCWLPRGLKTTCHFSHHTPIISYISLYSTVSLKAEMRLVDTRGRAIDFEEKLSLGRLAVCDGVDEFCADSMCWFQLEPLDDKNSDGERWDRLVHCFAVTEPGS